MKACGPNATADNNFGYDWLPKMMAPATRWPCSSAFRAA